MSASATSGGGGTTGPAETEPGLKKLAGKVERAEKALLAQLKAEQTAPTPHKLQTNTHANGWSSEVMAIAFWGLVNRRVLTVDENHKVRRGND